MCKWIDTATLTRARNGDEEAFAELMEAYYTMIYRVAYKWVGVQERAEDVTQDICLKLADAILSFEHKSSFDTWVYRMVVNKAKDYFKASSRRKAKHDNYEYVAENASKAEQEQHVRLKELMTKIHRLPEALRDTLLLVAVEGLSHAQAAEVLGVAEGTISYRISEARKALKEMMEAENE